MGPELSQRPCPFLPVPRVFGGSFAGQSLHLPQQYRVSTGLGHCPTTSLRDLSPAAVGPQGASLPHGFCPLRWKVGWGLLCALLRWQLPPPGLLPMVSVLPEAVFAHRACRCRHVICTPLWFSGSPTLGLWPFIRIWLESSQLVLGGTRPPSSSAHSCLSSLGAAWREGFQAGWWLRMSALLCGQERSSQKSWDLQT